MAAFDTAIAPSTSAPADTNNATLFTASADTSVLVDVVNIGTTGAIEVRVGITPSGGSVHWKIYDESIPLKDGIPSIGPWILRNGDAVTVRTDTANDAVFSLTGVASS